MRPVIKTLINFKKILSSLFEKKTTVAAIFLITVLGLIIYANSLTGQFIWDDEYLVQKNIYIRSWTNLPKIFIGDVAAGSGEATSYYRPLQIVSYAIDYSFWGLNTTGYHFINILLHILAALAIYSLIFILFNNRFLSFLTALLFISNPIHTEAVAFISGRSDLLASLFILISVILYIRQLHYYTLTKYLFLMLCYTAALLSKETSLILPVLLLTYHYVFKKKIRPVEFISILLLACIYIIFRVTALRALLFNAPYFTNALQRLPGFFVAISNYVRLLCLPFGLHMEYGSQLFKPLATKAITGMITTILLLGYAWRKRNTNNLISFSILWFFASLLPFSNIYFINAYMAEHWLYLPSIGFFLLLAYGLSALLKTKKFKVTAIIAAASLIIFYSCLTIMQNNYWKEPLSFYERTLQFAPDSPAININLAASYNDMGKHTEAIALLNKVIKIDPANVKAYDNMAGIYYNIGEKEKAIVLYEKALKINPIYMNAYLNLGKIYNAMGKKETAIEIFEKMIKIDPKYAIAYNLLGLIHKDIEGDKAAITFFEKAIEINPYFDEVYYNLGISYTNIGDKEKAIEAYQAAIKINPTYTDAYYDLGTLYKDIGKREMAVSALVKAIETDPTYVKAYNNLGVVTRDAGKNEDAIKLFTKALEINPTYALACYNLSISYFQTRQYDLAIKYCDTARKLGYNADAKFLQLLESFQHQN